SISPQGSCRECVRGVEHGQLDIGRHYIVEGEVGVVFQYEELAALPRGSFFGEISCLLGEPVVPDIVARSPLRCLVIPPAEVDTLLLQHPRVTLRMLKIDRKSVV